MIDGAESNQQEEVLEFFDLSTHKVQKFQLGSTSAPPTLDFAKRLADQRTRLKKVEDPDVVRDENKGERVKDRVLSKAIWQRSYM